MQEIFKQIIKAIKDNDTNAIQLLAKSNDLNAKDESGSTPLHMAAAMGNKDVVEQLMQLSVNMNARNDNGDTAFHWAAWAGRTDIVKLFLDHGVDVTKANDFGITALRGTAIMTGREPLQTEIELAYDIINHLNDKDEYKKEFSYLLQHSTCVDQLDFEKINPEVYQSCFEELKKFLALSSDLEANEKARCLAHKIIEKLCPDVLKTIDQITNDNSLTFKIFLLKNSRSNIESILHAAMQFVAANLFDSRLKQRIMELRNWYYRTIAGTPMSAQPLLGVDPSIEEHASHLYHQLYSIAYPHVDPKDGIARYEHGITHTARAAKYVPVFANLYKKYGDFAAQGLTEEDVKLTQIAALLHDAGRENEGVDYWDQDSAALTYVYLRKIGVTEEKAKLLAEAVANKDQEGGKYFELVIEGNTLYWKEAIHPYKNIYQKLIHDADCLDIIRVRDHFKAKYLDFYKEIAKDDVEAFDEMAELIIEARSFIALCGDGPVKDSKRKKYYEHENAYQRLTSAIREDARYRLLNSFAKLLPLDELQKPAATPTSIAAPNLDVINIEKSMHEGKVFARAVSTPSALAPKLHFSKVGLVNETLAQLELRKTARRKGTPTRCKKSNNIDKNGNPHRSISMLGFGAGVFSCAGYLIVDPKIDAITSISKKNASTGYGKKESFCPPSLSKDEKELQLKNLIAKLKMGGSSVTYQGFASNHVELTYNLEDYDAIYYTPDPTLGNLKLHSSALALHQEVPFLQAIYLQQEYEALHHKKLPIYEYSALHNYIHKVDEAEYTDEKLQEKWFSVCIEYIKQQSSDVERLIHYAGRSINELKVCAMYGEKLPADRYYPADLKYDAALRNKINEKLQQELLNLVLNNLKNLKRNKISFCVYKAYEAIQCLYEAPGLNWMKQLINKPSLLEEVLFFLSPGSRFVFLQKIGLEWVKEITTNEADLEKILSLLRDDNERAIIEKELAKYSHAETLSDSKIFNAATPGLGISTHLCSLFAPSPVKKHQCDDDNKTQTLRQRFV